MTEAAQPQNEPYKDVLARFRGIFPNVRVLDFPEVPGIQDLSVTFLDKAPTLPKGSKSETVILGEIAYKGICARVRETDPETEVMGIANDCRSFLLCMVIKNRIAGFISVRNYPNDTARKRKS